MLSLAAWYCFKVCACISHMLYSCAFLCVVIDVRLCGSCQCQNRRLKKKEREESAIVDTHFFILFSLLSPLLIVLSCLLTMEGTEQQKDVPKPPVQPISLRILFVSDIKHHVHVHVHFSLLIWLCPCLLFVLTQN